MRILGPDGQPLSSGPQPSDEIKQAVAQALELANSGNLEPALQQMALVFQQDVVSDLVIDTTLQLITAMSELTGNVQPVAPSEGDEPLPPSELELFQALQADRNNPVIYYNLGNRFFQLGQPAMARPFMIRCRELLLAMQPEDMQQAPPEYLQLRQAADVDYAQVLMDTGDYGAAIDAFHALNDTYGGLPIWLLLEMAECYALTCQLDEADTVYDLASPESAAAFPGMDEVREEVGDLLARARDFEDLSQLGLRGWHYIQTRSLLMETNPDENVPGERFVFWQPSEEDIAWVVGMTAAFLDQRGLAPDTILWLGESGEPLARLFSHWWEVDPEAVRPYQSGDNSATGEKLALLCLAHSYDIPNQEVLTELAIANPDLILFALDLHWTDRQFITPDIAGFMTQICNLPWESRLQMETPDSQPVPIEETRDPHTIATEIAAQFGEAEDFDAAAKEIIEEMDQCSDLILDHRDGTLSRKPLPMHSPVKSPKFGI